MRRESSSKLATTDGVFARVINEYLASTKFQGMRENTRTNWGRYLRMAAHPDTLGSVPLEEIRPAIVDGFLDEFHDRPAAQQKALGALRALERWALKKDKLLRTITTGLEAPGSDGGYQDWDNQQIVHAEQHARPCLAKAITLGHITGQRGSDLVKMCWTDFETNEGRLGIKVVQKKTNVKLWIPFPKSFAAVIDRWPRHLGPILRKENGEPFTRPQLTDHWLDERRRPEMAPVADMTLHGLRSTCVLRLRNAGLELPLICAYVGMSPNMVARYTRKSDQIRNALAAVHRLDQLERTEPERRREQND